MKKDKKSHEPGELRATLLAELKTAEEATEDFNASLFNHKHLFPGAAIALLILLYLGMIEPAAQFYTWVMIGLLFVGLAYITFWKRREAERLNTRLEAAQKAFKEYERGRRRKKKKNK